MFLGRQYVLGRLSTDELGRRVHLALHARSGADLREAFVGLPPAWRDAEEVRRLGRSAKRGLLVVLIALFWVFASLLLLLAVAFTALLHGLSTSAAIGFPLVWLALSVLAWRAVRRV